jgi:hypothetical protein
MPAYAMGSARSVITDPGFATSPPVPNPADGKPVIMSPFSGPSGSPFDAKVYPTNVWPPVLRSQVADPTNVSTGALNTGIGIGLNCKVAYLDGATVWPTTPGGGVPIKSLESGFTILTTPGGNLPSQALAVDSRLMAIGGGRSVATPVKAGDYSHTLSSPNPYTAGYPLEGFGGGGSRDAGAGPAFTGFPLKLVNATGDTAPGGVLATGYVNRSGVTVKGQNCQFGSSTTANAAVA